MISFHPSKPFTSNQRRLSFIQQIDLNRTMSLSLLQQNHDYHNRTMLLSLQQQNHIHHNTMMYLLNQKLLKNQKRRRVWFAITAGISTRKRNCLVRFFKSNFIGFSWPFLYSTFRVVFQKHISEGTKIIESTNVPVVRYVSMLKTISSSIWKRILLKKSSNVRYVQNYSSIMSGSRIIWKWFMKRM